MATAEATASESIPTLFGSAYKEESKQWLAHAREAQPTLTRIMEERDVSKLSQIGSLRDGALALPIPASFDQNKRKKAERLRQLYVDMCDVTTAIVYTAVSEKNSGYAAQAVEALNELDKRDIDPRLRKLVEQSLGAPWLAVTRANQAAETEEEKMASKVSDPESEKYGGPDTRNVIKICLGRGQNSSLADAEAAAASLLIGKLTNLNVREIKRGAPLTSLVSPRIPTGTKIFPIRVIADSMGNESRTDYYFFRDEFGEWSAVPKS